MLKSLTHITILVLLLVGTSTNAQVVFQKLTMEEALIQSRASGKHIFIDFRADWCKPCIAMELETFSNTEVGNTINQRYIPIKADVDYFEWMDVKEDYNVAVLPTILIVNSQGAVQKRIIGQKDASGLMSELGLDYEDKGDIVIENPESDIPPTDKKECALVRWWRKISR